MTRQLEPASPARASRWESLGPIDDYPGGELHHARCAGQHLVVARLENGDAHVLDNRCPHEGYPLAQGALAGCALTCCWHNWKFDVRDGQCLLGGEGVRAYRSRIRAGQLEVDVAEPDPAEGLPGLLESLAAGLFEGDVGRALRDGIRLLQAGRGPWRLLADLACEDARRAEYGTTHVLPVAADVGRFLDRYPGPEAMVAIAPALDLCADTNRRLPQRPQAAPLPASLTGSSPGADLNELLAAVEAEDAERAEGLLRGAFEGGLGRHEASRWLLAAISAHFTDFGHQLIYLVKSQELLDGVESEAGSAVAEEVATELLPALLYSTVLGTREDTLPYMRPYRAFLERIESQLSDVAAAARSDVPFESGALRDAVLDGRSEDALELLWSALRSGVDAPRVARALVAAAAHRLLRYDPRLERDVDVAENFLWASHRFTFASAVRNATDCFAGHASGAANLRLLFQALAFIHTGRPMDLPLSEQTSIDVPTEKGGAEPESVLAAIAARDPRAAVVSARACWAAGHRLELQVALEDFTLSDPVVRPIVVAHVIKTTVAAFEEAAALQGSPDEDVPILAIVRAWSLPLVERRVRGLVHTSLRWVVDGQVPRKLTQ